MRVLFKRVTSATATSNIGAADGRGGAVIDGGFDEHQVALVSEHVLGEEERAEDAARRSDPRVDLLELTRRLFELFA